jgi:PqqD family protein of HPr-rel-A system
MKAGVLSRRPVRRPDVWLRKTKEETAIYDPGNGAVHILNETALAIWELCDGETRVEEMIEAICELCGMHRDVVVEDVGRILTDFGVTGLITWRVEP